MVLSRLQSFIRNKGTYKAWIHKGCSGVYGALTGVKDYKCERCKGFHDDEEK